MDDRSRRRRRHPPRPTSRAASLVVAVAAVTVGSLALAGALGVGAAHVLRRDVQHLAADASHAEAARVAAALPARGVLLDTTIPATTSHFRARTALVYLPPAALGPHPVALPVAILLSGQSRGASPEDLETGGHIRETMDAIAARDHGRTPIVVVPDQLTDGSVNPMCVDGPLGNALSYLTVDVPAWIRSHYDVETAARDWTIGGFSEGGTCAIQLGAGRPDLFGNLIDVSGERVPSIGSVAKTIRVGFAGNVRAYDAALPATELARHTPYRDSDAFFAAGQDDRTYGPVLPVMSALVRKAGMRVTTFVVPAGVHGWGTASQAIAAGMAWLQPRVGLGPSA